VQRWIFLSQRVVGNDTVHGGCILRWPGA
jgi:hypothetical protein